MNMTVQALQRRLMALGFNLPTYGADGDPGAETLAAIDKALDEIEARRWAVDPTDRSGPVLDNNEEELRSISAGARIIPAAWMPTAKISRIIFHWTAGQNRASEDDRKHYHVLIEGDGKLIRGVPSIDLNTEPKAKAGYAAHTLNCNTGSIGVSLCGMALAVESPFNPGKQPITRAQWDALASVLAQLCKHYGIKVDRKTVLSHAEVQETLGITQRGKWDISRLPFDDSIKGAAAIGDQMRAIVKGLL